MKQIVIISGKGGTGKTTLSASLAVLAENKIMCDCDVDAADLFLLLDPQDQQEEEYSGSRTAVIDHEKCTRCGQCMEYCHFKAIKEYTVNPVKCEGCGLCSFLCPVDAVTMIDSRDGRIFVSQTKYGLFFHAQLYPGKGNSGKLVTEIRKRAQQSAKSLKSDFIIIDGSPGIGCPVIASLTGAELAVIVIEPTISGEHDLKRIIKLTEHFNIRTMVCINKFDINEQISNRIEQSCGQAGVPIAGRIPYDRSVIKAMVHHKPIMGFAENKVTREIRSIWEKISTGG